MDALVVGRVLFTLYNTQSTAIERFVKNTYLSSGWLIVSERQNPEDAAKHELTTWLHSNGADVYWEKRNNWGYETFWIDGGGHAAEKPDLLIDFGGEIYVVETKSGESKSQVYDSSWQVMRYWTNFVTRDEETYMLGERAVEIDGFLTATKWSWQGHLFDPRVEVKLTERDFGSGRKNAITRGKLPPTEFSMTEQHIRNLWRHMKNTIADGQLPAVGSLLSTSLHPSVWADPAPAILITEGNEQKWRCFDDAK